MGLDATELVREKGPGIRGRLARMSLPLGQYSLENQEGNVGIAWDW